MGKVTISIPDYWEKKIRNARFRFSHLVITGYKALTEKREENMRINEIEVRLDREVEFLRFRINKIEQKLKDMEKTHTGNQP